jgi:hypothetical protein
MISETEEKCIQCNDEDSLIACIATPFHYHVASMSDLTTNKEKHKSTIFCSESCLSHSYSVLSMHNLIDIRFFLLISILLMNNESRSLSDKNNVCLLGNNMLLIN